MISKTRRLLTTSRRIYLCASDNVKELLLITAFRVPHLQCSRFPDGNHTRSLQSFPDRKPARKRFDGRAVGAAVLAGSGHRGFQDTGYLQDFIDAGLIDTGQRYFQPTIPLSVDLSG